VPHKHLNGALATRLGSSFWNPFFAAILLYVSAVSAYDGYLVVCTGDMIQHVEKNPIGLLLIKSNGGDPSLFLRFKAAGTTIAVFALGALNRRSRRLARTVALARVVFQSGLLFFLEHN
jgi:hypothetical protein